MDTRRRQLQLLRGERLPAGWQLLRFGALTRIANGQVSPAEKPYADYVHIGPENIVSGSGNLVELRTAREIGLISGKYVFDDQSIVYSKIRPNLNKVCAPNFRGLCSADAYPIWPNEKITRTFLLCYMRSELFLRQAIAASMRTGLPKINRGDLNGIKVTVPPKKEQIRISEILGTWDLAIAQTSTLIEIKKKSKRALAQKLLSGSQRLPGSKDEWRDCKLGQVFRERKEINRADLPLLSVTGERGVIPHSESGRKDSSAENKSKYKRIVPGDVGYNTMRMWQGVSAVSNLEGIISPAYTVCVPKETIHGPFVGHLFKLPAVIHRFHRYSQGLVSDTLNLKFPSFAQVVVAFPPIAVQKKIAAVLDAVDDEIESLEKIERKLKEQKRGLMQKLLAGQVAGL